MRRWLTLLAALLLYALSFAKKLFEFVEKLFVLEETDTILKMLSLIDAALVASLVVMVIIGLLAGYVGPRFFGQIGKSEVKLVDDARIRI